MDEELNHFLRSGMTVVDFGSGPGKDLLLAAEIIEPKGSAIGVDFTDEMLTELTVKAKERNLFNVIAIKADMGNIPLDSNFSDIIISNCAINLTSDKQKAFDEAFRLLKSGGILLDADVIAEKDFDESVQANKKLWCSCISGALTAEKYTKLLEKAGFIDITIKYAGKSQIQFENKNYGIHSGLIFARKP
jgi:ubiquinone/menaquinone biosynthesis C-methylase UbiE